MKNRMKAILILLACTVVLSGCMTAKKTENLSIEDMKPEESNAVSFQIIGGKDVMPISGYYGPYPVNYSKDGNDLPDYITEEYYKMISEAGLNMISYSPSNYDSQAESILQSLEFAEKYNMGMFVRDTGVTGQLGDETLSVEEIAERIVDYYDYDSFCGMYLVDEPYTAYYHSGDGSRNISQYRKIAQILQYDLGLVCYSNMLPITDMPNQKEKYEQYMDEFCETFQPRVLMWDYYPFDNWRNGDMIPYFYNMGLVREHALESGIPFWAYIQAGSQWNDSWDYFDSTTPYYPNEAQFNWNINTCLAYGAQGLQYFPVIQPYHFAFAETEAYDFERNGLIGAWGNKTQWYNYAQNISKHIQAIDEVLMNSISKGIIVSGERAENDTSKSSGIIKEGTFRQLQSIDGDAMTGCFNYNGKTALYVVNYSMEYAQKITLHLNEACNMDMIQNGEKSYIKARDITLDMAAGEGVLLVLK